MSGLDYFAWIVLVVMLIAAVLIWVILAMLPGKIAKQRNHPQADAINVSGWLGALALGVFWPLALIWAFTNSSRSIQGSGENELGENERLQARVEELEAALVSHEDRKS
jgi:hypothetical protein